MSIETLKEQARRHEQKEEWLKALDQYKKAIHRLEADDQPDIGLYNRVGDLYVRVGRLHEAVEHYGKAVDLYMESELPNNAIAVCKKIIRNVPDRHDAYLRMGQIRAQQGFLPDARTNFLTYAERMQQTGDLDESFRALVEFCDLAPEDHDVRVAVAEQMASHDRVDDAVAQLSVAYHALVGRGDTMAAIDVETRIRELDPEADLSVTVEPSRTADELVAGVGEDAEIVDSYGDIEIGRTFSSAGHEADDAFGEAFDIERHILDGSSEEEEEAEELAGEVHHDVAADEADEADEAVGEAGEEEEEVASAGFPPWAAEDDLAGVSEDMPFAGIEEAGEAISEEEYAEEVYAEQDSEPFDLPLMTFDDDEEIGEVVGDQQEETEGDAEDEDDAEPFELPLMTFDTDEESEEESDEEGEPGWLEPAASSEAAEEAAEEAFEEAFEGAFDEDIEEAFEEAAGDFALEEEVPSLASVRARIEEDPDDVNLRQRLVETAYRAGDEAALAEAYLGLGETLQRDGQAARARAAYQQCLQHDPANAAAHAALGQAAEQAAEPVKEVAAHEEYVDLGALVLDDDAEKTTRFTVAYQEPSGDEQADFAKMLSQFKEKVSQNLDADDVRAHHDLGTAYKEMGLLDEAVSEFQAALRASATHLPTYELLGQTFMEMGRMDMAIRSLERAVAVDSEIEDELIGIYYYLARAYETMGRKDDALEFYDRVFSLDINFADVTERLRTLR
jgi:tetratricopeptide (TPR) repeat protein